MNWYLRVLLLFIGKRGKDSVLNVEVTLIGYSVSIVAQAVAVAAALQVMHFDMLD